MDSGRSGSRAPDPLQGDSTATYTCEEMVAAVERSESPPDFLDEWRGAYVELLDSPDPDDPCAGRAAAALQHVPFPATAS